jgi:hypothetical protein
MKQATASVFVPFLLCLLPVLGFCQDVSKLSSVKRIYIGDLGREERSDLVREKIRLALMKSDRFRVVEKPESADAILTGVAGVVRTTDPISGTAGGGTSFAGIGVLCLVDVKSDETIWVSEYKRGFGLGGASSRVANKAVEKLLKDAKAADRKGADVRK